MTIINTKGDTVDSTSEVYDNMVEYWQLPMTLMGGERAMKDATTTYLPKEPMETDPQYQNRLARTTLKNYFGWAIENHTGRVFKKPVVMSDDVDDTIKEYNKNLDLLGNDVDAFYREVFRDMLIKGISFVYVDFPRSSEDMTLADELEADLRPYCIHIKAEQLIKAVSGVVNGRVVLTRAHILETAIVPSGKWGSKSYEKIRVLYPGYWELYDRTGENSSWILIDSGETSLNYIPLVPLYGRKTGFCGGLSPLQNLANLNRAHWQSLSDQMNITHVARVPILFGTGFDEGDGLTVGTKSAIMGPDGSELEFVEHTGKAIEAGMNELKDLEERMLLESLEMLSEGASETATSRSLDISDINCSLQTLAIKLEKAISKVNDIMSDYDEIERVGSVVVNTDFGLQLRDGSESNLLLKMRQSKNISLPAFQKEVKRRGVLSFDFNSEEDIKLLKAEAKELLPEEQPYVDEDGKQIVGDDEAGSLDTGKPRLE